MFEMRPLCCAKNEISIFNEPWAGFVRLGHFDPLNVPFWTASIEAVFISWSL
jgi:hypothetical protein